MLNVLDRKFIIFGMVFWPQDFFIFGIAMLTFVVFIVLFTVVFGRIFCGWACPQTIFMEMVFRKIEYWIDGDAEKQKRLKAMPWNGEKILKRTGKFVAFFTMSFIIANYFLAYLIGMDDVMLYIDPQKGVFYGAGDPEAGALWKAGAAVSRKGDIADAPPDTGASLLRVNPRCAGSSRGELPHMITARSITFCNSRTLPGHE